MAYKYAITANSDLREKMRETGVTFWQIADRLGVCEMTVNRRFRKELPKQEKIKMLGIIDEIASERNGAKNNA